MYTKEFNTRYCLANRQKNMDKPTGLICEILVKFIGKHSIYAKYFSVPFVIYFVLT